MNLKRWLSVILTMGLILALTPLSVQADPYNHPYESLAKLTIDNPGHSEGSEESRIFKRLTTWTLFRMTEKPVLQEAPMAMPMAGTKNIVALTTTRSISGPPIRVHTIPVTMRIMEDRRSPMSHPLPRSLGFLTRNPNPITPNPQLQAYPAI